LLDSPTESPGNQCAPCVNSEASDVVTDVLAGNPLLGSQYPPVENKRTPLLMPPQVEQEVAPVDVLEEEEAPAAQEAINDVPEFPLLE
jgi:hypothetical protein